MTTFYGVFIDVGDHFEAVDAIESHSEDDSEVINGVFLDCEHILNFVLTIYVLFLKDLIINFYFNFFCHCKFAV